MMQNIEMVMKILGKIKDIKRKGWQDKNILNGESVADHMYGVSLLVLMCASKELDRDKCIRLALIHDLQEAYVGDYTPFDEISREEKAKKEKAAVATLAKELGFLELEELFEEYEANESLEARFVRDVDRAEAVLQAKYYDDNQRSESILFPEFYTYAKKHLNEEDGLPAKWIKKLKS